MQRRLPLILGLSVILASLALAAPALAARSLTLGARGELVVDENGAPAEELTLPADLAPRLLAVSPGQSLVVEDWPMAPGERAPVVLSPFSVYAPGARILAVEPDGMHEVARSPTVFLRGDTLDTRESVLVIVEPGSRAVRSIVRRGAEMLALEPARRGGHLLRRLDATRTPGGKTLAWSCGQETTELDRLLAPSALVAPRLVAKAITSLHTATIAVDTDNELMSLKFGNSTSAATSYIANLFAAMNVIYERDLLVRLLQGTTFLRVATDPWTAAPTCSTSNGTTFCSANGTQLNQFKTYWTGGCGGACVNDAHAAGMLLSGKTSPSNSASGIAGLGTLCGSNAYSFNQVFMFAQDTSANDIMVTAHEIGHNFGSPHTHCYSPPLDDCYNSEAGCYSGTKICPAPATYSGITNVTGTLMSYCHLSGLAGCTSSPVFHTGTVSLLAPLVQNAVGICIFPFGGLFASGFENGLKPPWSGKVP